MIRLPSSRRTLAAATAAASLAVVTTAVATTKNGHRGRAPTATAQLRDASGGAVGRVVMRQGRQGKVSVTVRARGLQPGFHGFHIHEKGVCEAPSQSPEGKTGAFLSAGGHIKSGAQTHGAHSGDMPPLFAQRDGTARAAFAIDSFGVRKLVEGDASAAMIHAGADNLGNIPPRYSAGGQPGPDEETKKTGDAGDRAACGVVRVRQR